MPNDQHQMTLTPRYLWTRFRGWFSALSLWVKIVIFLAVAAGIGFILAQVAPSPPAIVNAELVLKPATGMVANNATLSVEVDIINPTPQDIYAVEMYIFYDPQYLDISHKICVSGEDRCIELGDSLFTEEVTREVVPGNAAAGTPTSCPTTIPGCNVIHLVRGAPYPGERSTTAYFVSLRFRTIVPPTDPLPVTTPVEFNLTDSHVVMVASNGGTADILDRTKVHNGSYTIVGALPCTPPSPDGWGGFICGVGEGCYDGGTEYPDADPTTVCCSRPCRPPTMEQLTILSVNSLTSAPRTETIIWNTDPETPVGASCNTTYTQVQPPGASGGPVSSTGTGNPPINHKVELGGLTPGATYNFTITCTATGYVDATYQGQFIVSESEADILRIIDVGISDITCRSFRVTYGTTKPALGTVAWESIPWGLGSCTVSGAASSRTDNTYSLSHATVATPLSLTNGICSKLPFNTCTSNSDCTAPAQCRFQYCVNITAAIANPPESAGPKYWRVSVPACPAIEPDANVIMKVDRDRVCKNWLYCRSSVRLKNQQGKYDDLCFDLGICDALDPMGYCANPVALEGSTGRANLTFDTPSKVHFIKDISGYAKVGLNWGEGHCSITKTQKCAPSCPAGESCTAANTCSTTTNQRCYSSCPPTETCILDTRIEGLYPYVRMDEVGRLLKVQNGNFESGYASPWRAQNKASLYVYRKPGDTVNSSFALKVVPGEPRWSGAYVPLGAFNTTPGLDPLMLTFRARTDQNEGYCEEDIDEPCSTSADCPWIPDKDRNQACLYKTIAVQLAVNGRDYHNFVIGKGAQRVTLGYGWATYQMRLGTKAEDGALPLSVSGQANLQFVQGASSSESPSAIYIDEVSLQPVLTVAKVSTIPRSCRTYPKPDAPACDFLEEETGKEYRGWKGYCVERQDPDPERAFDSKNDCLIWWPVDVLLGASDLFAGGEVVGYKGRKPLYYCLESKGDWPYYDRKIMSANYLQWDGGADRKLFSVNVIGLHILKNEIIEVRVNDIEMDDTKDDPWACFMRNDSKDINPSLEGKKGTIILNQMNKDHWSDGFLSSKNCGGGVTAAHNPHTYLRCEANDHEDDCRMVSARLEFNPYDELTNLEVFFKNVSGDGRIKASSATITYRGERCNVIAQVVTPEGDAIPYTSRLEPGGFRPPYNAPHYPYTQDYEPYGGLVPPKGAGVDPGDPTTWPGPAYVEAPLTQQAGAEPPYQYRAGSPYGMRFVGGCGDWRDATGAAVATGPSLYCQYDSDCRTQQLTGTCFIKTCAAPAGTEGQWCATDNDCDDIGQCIEIQGEYEPEYRCDNLSATSCSASDIGNDAACHVYGTCSVTTRKEGGRVCLTGGDDRVGKSCEENPDCGYVEGDVGSPGICAGVDKPKEVKLWENFYKAMYDATFMGAAKGEDTLKKLFAKVYGVWAFDERTKKYAFCSCKYNATTCPNVPAACTVEAWDTVGLSTGPSMQPRVGEMRIQYLPNIIEHAGGVVLEFTANVHPDHKPLAGYRVEWGDGSPVTEVAGLRSAERSTLSDPYLVTHTYECGEGGKQVGRDDLPDCGTVVNGLTLDENCWDSSEGVCKFKPFVQVTDNWGLCNGNCAPAVCAGSLCAAPYRYDNVFYRAPTGVSDQPLPVWTPYGGEIRVKP
ncbi:MAG: hypothetical protein AB1352_00975 [Patescibacteria group bacterium]